MIDTKRKGLPPRPKATLVTYYYMILKTEILCLMEEQI